MRFRKHDIISSGISTHRILSVDKATNLYNSISSSFNDPFGVASIEWSEVDIIDSFTYGIIYRRLQVRRAIPIVSINRFKFL